MEGGEGWMERTCVFNNKEICSVKTEFKLKPESLVEFCKLCDKNPRILAEERKTKDISEIVKHAIAELKPAICELLKEKKKK